MFSQLLEVEAALCSVGIARPKGASPPSGGMLQEIFEILDSGRRIFQHFEMQNGTFQIPQNIEIVIRF